MFVYTLKASGIKFFLAIVLSIAILVTIVAVVPEIEKIGDVAVVATDYSGVSDAESAAKFLQKFGYTLSGVPAESCEVKIPDEFAGVYQEYNEIQRAQGLNLKKYCGKTAIRYTFEVTNYDGYDGTVLATVIIHKNKVIAGDVCGVTGEGFIHGFEKPQ